MSTGCRPRRGAWVVIALFAWLACVAAATAAPTNTSVSAVQGGDRILIEGTELPTDGNVDITVGGRTAGGTVASPWTQLVVERTPERVLLALTLTDPGDEPRERYVHKVSFDMVDGPLEFSPPPRCMSRRPTRRGR